MQSYLICMSLKLSNQKFRILYGMRFALNPQDEDGRRGLPAGLARKGCFTTYRTWSERSSVYGDSNARVKQIII